MKFTKLNQKGVAHYLVAAVVVLAVGAIGTYVLTATHAATPASVGQSTTGATSDSSYHYQDLGTTNVAGLEYMTVYACRLNLAGGNWEVASQLVLPGKTNPTGGPYSSEIIDTNDLSIKIWFRQNNSDWLFGTVQDTTFQPKVGKVNDLAYNLDYSPGGQLQVESYIDYNGAGSLHAC